MSSRAPCVLSSKTIHGKYLRKKIPVSYVVSELQFNQTFFSWVLENVFVEDCGAYFDMLFLTCPAITEMISFLLTGKIV